MSKWTNDEIESLRSGVAKGMSHSEIGAAIGRSAGAVRSKANLAGIVRDRVWSVEHEQALRDLYTNAGNNGVLGLNEFAKRIGRDVSNVSRKAAQLGLATSYTRKKVDLRKDRRRFKGDKAAQAEHAAERMRAWIHENGHPRGMLGMKHTPQAIAAISKKSTEMAAAMTPERQAAINLKIMKTRVANGTNVLIRPNASWKAGWHEIGGKRKYYRSNWEANYAHYLEWLKGLGEIKDWLHEPKTFWFEGIKRGSVSYLPDFMVTENDGREVYHEVKGWMDDRSRVKIARMGRYHPNVTLVVIDSKAYRELRRKVSRLVPGWQDTPRDGRGA